MPINKKEKLVYTFLMVIFMAGAMTTYNVLLAEGFSVQSIQHAWLIFPVMFTIAFIIEWFIVAPIAFRAVGKLIKATDSEAKKGLTTALCFVLGMASLMSLVGTIIFGGFTANIPLLWLKAFCVNFPVAFILQVAIARPLIGSLFRSLFPIGTIVEVK